MDKTSDPIFLGVRAAFEALVVPDERGAISAVSAPGMNDRLYLGRSKSQYHLIFMGDSDIRSNVLNVQNRLARRKAYDLDLGPAGVRAVEFTSLGVRVDAPHLDFLCAVVVKLREVGFGELAAVTAQTAMFAVEDHILLLLSNLASDESMTGLFGELFLLRLLLRQGVAPSKVMSWWTGPDSAQRDFSIPRADRSVFVEVKTTKNPAFPRVHHIGNLAQVIQGPAERLFLASVGLERSSQEDAGAESIDSLAQAILEQIDGDTVATQRFRECLLRYGAPPRSDGYICFDLDWTPRPRWSLIRWSSDAWLLDMDESHGVRVPSEQLFDGTDVIRGSIEFDISVRRPVHPILHAANPSPLDENTLREVLGE